MTHPAVTVACSLETVLLTYLLTYCIYAHMNCRELTSGDSASSTPTVSWAASRADVAVAAVAAVAAVSAESFVSRGAGVAGGRSRQHESTSTVAG